LKKILFLLLLISTSIFASDQAYIFYVENPTMGKAYFNIFNAIVALMSSEMYGEILQLVFLLGGFFVFVMGVFQVFQGQDGKTALVDFSKYMVAGTILLTLVIPNNGSNNNATMVVESKSVPVYYCEEENQNNYSGFSVSMPETLAWGFSAINSIGTGSTEMAAAVFSNVSTNPEVQKAFQSSSIGGFGSELDQVKGLLGVKLSDLYDRNTSNPTVGETSSFGKINVNSVLGGFYSQFLNECVFMVKSADSNLGSRIVTLVENTGDIARTLSKLYPASGNGAFASYKNTKAENPSPAEEGVTGEVIPAKMLITVTNSDGEEVTGSCGDFYTNIIYPALSKIKEDTNIACLSALRKVTAAGLYSVSGSDDVSAPMLENEAINAGLFEAYRASATSSKIATDISYASGKTNAEFILNSTGTGFYMAKMLPYMQMGIRAVLYSFFPFVFLVMLLPGGFSVIKSYLQSMLWVELWSPVAAILNMFLSYFSIDQLSTTYASKGINAITQSRLLSDSNMLASVGGYLYASVPALTWLVLKGSAQMLGSITGGMAAGFAKNLDSQNIRQDLVKSKKTELLNEKTGKNMSMAEVEFNQAMGNAAQESEKESLYYNLNNGDYLANKTAEARKDNVDTSKKIGGGNTDIDYNKLLSSGAYEQMSENKRAEYLSGLSEGELKEMAAGSSSATLSKDIKNTITMRHIAKAGGYDLNSSEGAAFAAETMAKLDSGTEVGKIIQDREYMRHYASSHNMEYKGEDGKMHKFTNDTSLKTISENAQKIKADMAATEATKQLLNENQEQAYQSKIGAQGKAINNKEDFKNSLKNVAGVNLSDYTIHKNKNGDFVAEKKEGEGVVYVGQKGKFLRRTEFSHKQGESYNSEKENLVAVSNSKAAQSASNALGRKQAAKTKADMNIINNNSSEKLVDSFTLKEQENVSQGGAIVDKNLGFINRAMKGLDKDSNTYQTLSKIKEELSSDNDAEKYKGVNDITAFKSIVEGQNQGFSLMSENKKQEAILNSDIKYRDLGNMNLASTQEKISSQEEAVNFFKGDIAKQTHIGDNKESLNDTFNKGVESYMGEHESASREEAELAVAQNLKTEMATSNEMIKMSVDQGYYQEVLKREGLDGLIRLQTADTAKKAGSSFVYNKILEKTHNAELAYKLTAGIEAGKTATGLATSLGVSIIGVKKLMGSAARVFKNPNSQAVRQEFSSTIEQIYKTGSDMPTGMPGRKL